MVQAHGAKGEAIKPCLVGRCPKSCVLLDEGFWGVWYFVFAMGNCFACRRKEKGKGSFTTNVELHTGSFVSRKEGGGEPQAPKRSMARLFPALVARCFI